jgi:hypothetical protein
MENELNILKTAPSSFGTNPEYKQLLGQINELTKTNSRLKQ